MEGRAKVELSKSNTKRSNSYGGVFEIGYKIRKYFGALIDIPFVFNNKAFGVGMDYGLKIDFNKCAISRVVR